jgi:hypothetical protein
MARVQRECRSNELTKAIANELGREQLLVNTLNSNAIAPTVKVNLRVQSEEHPSFKRS